MKNKVRRLSRSLDKEGAPGQAKSKDKMKSKKSDSSIQHDSCRHSFAAASPRGNKIVEKYKTYIQFIATNKLTTDQALPTQEKNINRKKNSSSTDRRNSPVPYFKGRKSAMSKFYQPPSPSNMNFTQRNSFPKQHLKEVNKKDVPFFVKGKNPNVSRHSQQNKERSSLKKGQENKDTKSHSKNKTSTLKQIKNGKKPSTFRVNMKSANENAKLDQEEEKLCEKLFKGIQFYRDLGRGAHALVRSAVDWNNKRKIAVKVYEKMALSEEQLTSIERQIQILDELSHPNIIALYEIIETFKTINLVMEYGGGNSLDQYMKSKPEGYLDQKQAKLIFRQILQATEYLHSHNITHRDIKTENILLNKHLHLKIIDFGFSLKCVNGPQTLINSYCGTPTYMAPEVVSKTPHNPQLSDRWSLGILLFNMLNGHCPFRASNQKQLFAKIHLGQFEYFTDFDEEAKLLIKMFLCKTPSERISPGEALKHIWLNK